MLVPLLFSNLCKMAVKHENKTTGIILAAVTGGTAVALSVICYPFVSPALRRICLPYVPATTQQVENVLEALRGRSGPLLDIGSGDGRIVLAAAAAGFPAHGVELNPWLVAFSKLRAALARLPAPATFSRADLWKFSLKPYRNIVVFGVEEMMTELEVKLDAEMHQDACVVACRFPLPGKVPVATLGAGVDTVWLYTR